FRRQPNGWECGYCVMMAMYDFVIYNGEHMLVDKTAMVRQGEINEFVERTLKVEVEFWLVSAPEILWLSWWINKAAPSQGG
ncbi:hypothetical protein M8C21_000059, partial [Ambrosia artemisiifolia]